MLAFDNIPVYNDVYNVLRLFFSVAQKQKTRFISLISAGTVAGLGHQARSAGQIAEHVIIGFLVVALAISVSFIVYRLYRKRVEKYPVDKPVIEMNAVENELYMKYS